MIARTYTPLVYLEGVKFPIKSVTVTARANGKIVIAMTIPGDPMLWPKFDIRDVDNGETTENGMEIVAESELQGIQPRTLVQVFALDSSTLEEVFIAEGRVVQSGVTSGKSGTQISVVAFGSVFFIEETGMYMIETARSLGVNSNDDWDGRRGVTTTSNVVSKLKDEGLANGIQNLLEDAGLHSSQASNLTWRLLRLGQRLSIINNPSALGHFNETRLATILDKTVGQTTSTQPIAAVVMQILRMLRYFVLNIPAPSFLNALYRGTGVVDKEVGKHGGSKEHLTNDEKEERDDERTDVEYTALLTDLDITNPDDLKMNDLCIFPQMPMAPAPRCNVFFPVDYESVSVTYNWEQRPTRGISRLGGRASLSGDESESVRLPETYATNSLEHGRYYTMAEEKYRGVVLSTFNHDRPEFVDDMGSDYIRGYMTQSYHVKRYNGAIKFNKPCPLNLSPIPGLPAVILMRNGQHVLAHLDQVVHIMSVDQGCYTMPTFSMPRHYSETPPSNATGFWFEDDHFAQKNIGVYVYKDIIGKYFTAKDELSADPDVGDDLSILKHLYTNSEPGPDSGSEIKLTLETETESRYELTIQKSIDLGLGTLSGASLFAGVLGVGVEALLLFTVILVLSTDDSTGVYYKDTKVQLGTASFPTVEEFESANPIIKDTGKLMTEEEVEAAKEAPEAIMNAIDVLWADYKDHKYPEIYSYNYGRRIPITRKHLYEDFYSAVVSTDLNMVTGGYELKTNSLSLSEEDRESMGLELGDVIENETEMGDIKPMGCFIKERQECYIEPAARLHYGVGVARDASELIDVIKEIDEVADTQEDNLEDMFTDNLINKLNSNMSSLIDDDGDYEIQVP